MKTLSVFLIGSFFALAAAQYYGDDYADDYDAPSVRGAFFKGEEVVKVNKNENKAAVPYSKPNSPDPVESKSIRDQRSKSSRKRKPQKPERVSQIIPDVSRESQITPDAARVSQTTPRESPNEIIKIAARVFTNILEILTNHTVQGINNVVKNMNNHRDGLIIVEANTKVGQAVGHVAEKALRMFFKQNWTGVLAHIVQEVTDQTVEAGKELMSRISTSLIDKVMNFAAA
ncbi:uncharacterized protein LOC117171908 isoform X2 [Belonocnema kinseyi]|uniref:uncharacterized protein LOC117171908 isoform X2 n=1 Tax=Belonocnema kinseyi TaxID=2817044 RepID=UPI00143D6773|nr:uncharacterized protein LOC117171908 isoform X2 [Belonocnema kinseyi]